MTEKAKTENEEAFDKIDALVSAEKGQGNAGPEEIQIVEAPAPQKDEVAEGIEDLRKQLEAEKTARAEAEKRAFEAANREKRASTEAEDSNLRLFDTAIANTKREKDALRTAFKEAMTVGDFDKVSEIQEQMTQNAVNLRELENGKEQFKNRPKQAEVASADPVERFASQLSPSSAQWVRQHPEFVTNPAKQRQMFEAHRMAVETNGYQADTPAYFDFVEKYLGVGEPPQKTVETTTESPLSEAASATPRRSPAPTAAPVSRNGAASIANPTTVTLSAEERELAEMLGMTPKEYAINKAALAKEGRIGRTYN